MRTGRTSSIGQRATRLLAGFVLGLLVAPVAPAGGRPLALRHLSLDLPGPPSTVLSADVNHDRRSAPIIVLASVSIGAFIVAEAGLSFLGFVIPPPTPSWGNLLSGDTRELMARAPWLMAAPGIALTLTVLSFNLFGDALRDILDPRLRGA